MMAEILAIVLLFGGGAFAAFCSSPIGKAIAARIRERLDFTDRLLANKPPAGLEAGGRPS
jgi:hypothetical protein